LALVESSLPECFSHSPEPAQPEPAEEEPAEEETAEVDAEPETATARRRKS
jgi:hypothetical protein